MLAGRSPDAGGHPPYTLGVPRDRIRRSPGVGTHREVRQARTCDVARGCHFEASCEVPGSCERIEQRRETRIVPDIDFGRISGELLVEVVNGDVRAAARTGYCDVAGNCMSIESELRVSPHDIQLCLPVPELGVHCLSL